jgi:hypothetical protein
VELVHLNHAHLWHTPDGIAYATVPVAAHGEHWALRSSGFRAWMCRKFFEAEGKAPASQAVQDATGVLEGQALYAGEHHSVAVRVAEHDGNIFLDLADADWRAVRITPSGWVVVENPPVRFCRPRGMLALPEPTPGGNLDDLIGFVNLADRDHGRHLLVGWLQQTLRGRGPYPLLALRGQQGSAKSTHARLLRLLTDPNQAPLRAAPRDERDLAIAAANGHVVALDNLSQIPDWLSDALCRLSTGGGFTTRALFTDREETIFDYQRPAIVTAIDDVMTRGDLADRAICLDLLPIRDDARRTEAELFAEFEPLRPAILGALLSSIAAGLAELPRVRLASLPRMADFAVWAEACSRGVGRPAGEFLTSYGANRAAVNETALDCSPIVAPLRRMLGDSGTFEGTATELLRALELEAGEAAVKAREWPSRSNQLSNRLRRLAPNLRMVGIEVEFDLPRENNRSPRRLRLSAHRQENGRKPSSTSSTSSTPRETQGELVDDGLAVDDGHRPQPGASSTESPWKSSPVDDVDDVDDGLRDFSQLFDNAEVF